MKTVKIYEITQTEAYMMKEQCAGYSLNPYGKETRYYKGHDDGGIDYIIPDGFTISMANDEQLHFYDSKGNYCELVSRYGKPALVADNDFVFLKSAAAAALGKLGGSAKTKAKAVASRENGKKGGRPPMKTYYSVEHSAWGANGSGTAWFDNKTAAEKFSSHDYRDNPITHRVSKLDKIAEYDELVAMTNYELGL